MPLKFYIFILKVDFRETCKAFFKVCVGRDIVGHHAVVVLLISNHIKVACAGETKEDSLFLAGFLALGQ